MVQANPQILQVCICIASFTLVIVMFSVLNVSEFLHSASVTAHAAGAWKAKPPALKINSGAPYRVPPVNK